MKKKLVSLVLVATMALGLVACGSKKDDAKKSAGSKTPNNVLSINLASEPAFLDPALNSSVDGGCLAVNSFAGLYTYDKDQNLVPDLAKDMPEVSEDGTEYTIKMIESKWSNGDPVTAKDFIFSWNRVVNPDTAADYAYLFSVIKTNEDGTLAAEAVDDYTIKITLNAPCPYFGDLLAFPTFFPVHEDSVKNDSTPGAWAQEAGFVCNGAYTLKEWKHDESMVYVKNPEYHAADSVTMDELHFMLSADDTAIYAAYNSGDVDYIDSVPTDEVSKLLDNPEFGIIDNLGTYYACYNVNDPMFDGKTPEEAATMRKAINMLVDRNFIVTNVGQTGQVPADAFVPVKMADGNGGEFKNKSYYDVDKMGASSLEDAKKLLESVGYKFEKDGENYKCTPEIKMTYLTNDGTGHIAAAESMQQDFAALGIQMDIKSEEWNVFLEDRKAGNYTIAREGWLADYNDPVNMLEIFTSDSGNNDAQLGKNPSAAAPKWDAYDALIEQIRNEADFAKRVDLMHEAEDMLMDTGAIIPLYFYNDIYMQKSNVEGIYGTVFGMKYFQNATKK